MGFFADLGRMIKRAFRIMGQLGNIARGLGEITYGVGKTAFEAPRGIVLAWVQFIIFIQTLWVFATTNLDCAMRMMNNASYCAFFYILDVLGQMLYLIPRLAIYVLNVMGLPATQWETNIWDFLESVDRWFIDHVGIHIIHFPKSIRDSCFNCRRLKPQAFLSKVEKTAAEIKNPIVPLLTGGIGNMVGGLSRISNAVGSF
jgi:hypothetical protein